MTEDKQLNITSDTFIGWSLEEPIEKAPMKDMLPDWALPLLTTPDHWDNYYNDAVYEADKRIRKWIKTMRSTWTKRGLDRRYTFNQLSEILGLKEVVEVRKNYNHIAKVYAYYSTKISNCTTINGHKYKRVYTISPSRLRRSPYSLKLRLETMEEEGDWRNFKLPKDDLEPGHARNPRTDANMQARTKLGRERANAVIRQWRKANGRSKSRTES